MILQFLTEIHTRSKPVAEDFFAKVQAQYPETSLLRMYASPEYDDDVWIDAIAPIGEERETELNSFATSLALDILLEHGFQVMLFTKKPTLIES
jgi:hypothetical protein